MDDASHNFEAWWALYGEAFSTIYLAPRDLAEAAWHACKQQCIAIADDEARRVRMVGGPDAPAAAVAARVQEEV